MNALYTAAGRWLMDSWMRGAVLNMSSVSRGVGFTAYPPVQGIQVSLYFIGIRLMVWSNNGNALLNLYNVIGAEMQPWEGQYSDYNRWLTEMRYITERFLYSYAEFMEGK